MPEPLFNNILIEVQKAETITSSGIILTNEAENLEKAIVIALGPDCQTTLKENDTILLKSYSADTIKLDGKEYSFVKEEEILAKM